MFNVLGCDTAQLILHVLHLKRPLTMASSAASSTVAARISALQNRPSTSFGSDRTPGRTFLQKQRSLGNLAGQLDGANELLEARARLRHIGGTQKSPTKPQAQKPDQEPSTVARRRRTNSSVLEELADLLDTAIGEDAAQLNTTDSRDTAEDSVPDWPLPRTKSVTSRSPSKHALRHSVSAAKRKQSRQSPLRMDSSDTIGSSTAAHARGQSIDSNRPRSSTDTDIGHYHPLTSEAEREPVKLEVPKQMQDSKSPIKRRAALFEQLSQHEAVKVHDMPHTHDARNSTRIRRIWPPKPDATGQEKARGEFVTSLEKHHLQFHHGKDEALAKDNADSPPRTSSPDKPRTTHVPPIPLALPQLVDSRRRSRPAATALHESSTPASSTKQTSNSDHKAKRDTSFNWPLKWSLLRKTPDASIKESSIVARAEPDHHTSAKEVHETQHRVHDLLVAAHEATKEPVPSPHTDQQDDRESIQNCASMPGALADTPRGSSAAEKEVASQTSGTPAGTITPSTPRGRRRLQDLEVITHSSAEDQDSTYKVVRSFAVSRSRSRGGGVRVQVEIRSPKASPERGGEHTVIVTANVTPFDEQDEELNDAK